MRAVLVRVGVDQAYGRWNGPVDPDTCEFVYVPIPDKNEFLPGLATSYREIAPAIEAFARGRRSAKRIELPGALSTANTHLDPDFKTLTYGDKVPRGERIAELRAGDVVVFYSGLRPCRPCEHRLVYALIGLFRVRDVLRLKDVPESRWGENAHTRRMAPRRHDDVIVRADSDGSGRLQRCIPIGEFRNRAYRVRRDLLDLWGGLSCKDGYVQRSAVLPLFNDARRFVRWFEGQRTDLVAENNPASEVG